jgi:Ca2+-binding RTX toxin-like protein
MLGLLAAACLLTAAPAYGDDPTYGDITPVTPATGSSDMDGDGLPDVADCAPVDPHAPARNGTDANCDGVVDPPPPPVTLVLCSVGSSGNDFLVCGRGRQRLFGLAGDDVLSVGPGDDFAAGGPGADLLMGGAGRDTLSGGPGDDSLDGGTGADTLSGGDGDDGLVGGAGNDRINGGRGENLVRAGDGNDSVIVVDGRGGDVVSCGRGRDTVVADRSDVVSKDCEKVRRRH